MACESDHGAIIRAKLRGGNKNFDVLRFGSLFDLLAQAAVRRNTAGQDDALHAGRERRLDRRMDQHVNDRLLEACGDIGLLAFPLFLLARFYIMPYRSFDAAEAELVTVLREAR